MKLIRVLSTKPYTLPSNKGINVIQIDRACHARDPFFPALHVQFGILNLGVWWHLASFARFVGLYSQPYSIHRFALLYIQTRRILATDCTSTCTYTYLLHILSSSSQKINQTLLFNFFILIIHMNVSLFYSAIPCFHILASQYSLRYSLIIASES